MSTIDFTTFFRAQLEEPFLLSFLSFAPHFAIPVGTISVACGLIRKERAPSGYRRKH